MFVFVFTKKKTFRENVMMKISLFEKIKDEIKKCNVPIVVHIIVVLLLFSLLGLKPIENQSHVGGKPLNYILQYVGIIKYSYSCSYSY